MAAKLPLANRLRSLLVCPITGQVMDEQNPPLALPNGRVYSSSALLEMAGAREREVLDEQPPPLALPNGGVCSSSALLEMAGAREGQIECIATGETFDFSDLRKVFIS
ncbi:hypothetical protein T484DRAFT_1794189 [Baffinella frigidus]|nr:hypothetical protein T484DRAFT_1794189 [Cryptophyta sp. CCMP2293]